MIRILTQNHNLNIIKMSDFKCSKYQFFGWVNCIFLIFSIDKLQQIHEISLRKFILQYLIPRVFFVRSEEHTSELQSRENLVCRLLLEKKKIKVADASSRYLST